MPKQFKATAAIVTAWIATTLGAYWLGSGHQDSDSPAAENSAHTASHPPSGLSALNASERDSARTLSAPSSTINSAAKLLSLLDGSSGADLKRSEFRDLAENLSLDDVEQIIHQIAAMDRSPAQHDAYTAVLTRWGQLNPTAALEHVRDIKTPRLRDEATSNVLRSWAGTNPAAAVAFVTENPNNDLPAGSLGSVFRGIGNSMDTTAALSFLASITDPGQLDHANEAVRELYERNDKEVTAWTEALPPGDVRDLSVIALVDQWARYNPNAAKDWLLANTDPSNRSDALVRFSESWARTDPAAAATWAHEMNLGDSKGKALENVFRRWIDYDLAGAADYLVEQDPSPELDGALEQYIRQIRTVDPDATMAWAESISDPKRRHNAVIHVAKVWRGQDKEAYENYVSTSEFLTEAEREQLLGKEKTPKSPKEKIEESPKVGGERKKKRDQ